MSSNLDLLTKNIMQYIDYLKSQDIVTSDPKLNQMLVTFRAQYQVLVNTHPKMVLEYFTQYIYPHKEMILNNNEDYFLSLEYGEDEGGSEASLMGALHIKEMWKSKFTTEHKTTTFTYFKVFIKLVERYLVEHISQQQSR